MGLVGGSKGKMVTEGVGTGVGLGVLFEYFQVTAFGQKSLGLLLQRVSSHEGPAIQKSYNTELTGQSRPCTEVAHSPGRGMGFVLLWTPFPVTASCRVFPDNSMVLSPSSDMLSCLVWPFCSSLWSPHGSKDSNRISLWDVNGLQLSLAQ